MIQEIAGAGWLWPILVLILICLWLWTALRLRHATSRALPLSSGSARDIEAEDALKAAYALQETGDAWGDQDLARYMRLPEGMAGDTAHVLIASGWAREDAHGRMRLTEVGKARACELIRAHRLWEQYLVKREGMPIDAVHAEAHRREHKTSPEELERLDEELGHPAWDPHGHAIPDPGSAVPSILAHSLLEEATVRSRLRIACLDDEPAALLAQLVALGLEPGVDVRVVDQTPEIIRVRVNDSVIPLASPAAQHVFVVPSPVLPVPMGKLPVGGQARVVEVAGTGKHQRRMLDMGFVPGAEVATVRKAPLGDPIEYRIKGTAVALRASDADTVLVEEMGYE